MSIHDSQPPRNGIYTEGFKGKGMCSHCQCSFRRLNENTGMEWLICGHYGDSCKAVSRNCPGIRAIAKKK